MEEAWKYWVPQPILEDAVAKAPDSMRELKHLDPACGSGCLLVVASDLVVKLCHEEARHRGEVATNAETAEATQAENLHGVDIDPWATSHGAMIFRFSGSASPPEAKAFLSRTQTRPRDEKNSTAGGLRQHCGVTSSTHGTFDPERDVRRRGCPDRDFYDVTPDTAYGIKRNDNRSLHSGQKDHPSLDDKSIH